MNITDASKASAYASALTGSAGGNAPSGPAKDARSRTDSTDARAGDTASSGEKGDRFTASENPVGSALYDVTRTGRGRLRAESSGVMGEKTLHGERVSRKMADIPLATGRNLLHIYRADDES